MSTQATTWVRRRCNHRATRLRRRREELRGGVCFHVGVPRDEIADVARIDPVHTGGMSTGALIGGRFQLEALAGSGGMGAVYRARDTTTGDTVAVKLLHPHAYTEAARLT